MSESSWQSATTILLTRRVPKAPSAVILCCYATQVMPFHPHKEAATLDLGADNAPAQAYQQALDSEAELKRVLATIQHVRSGIYQTLDQV